MKKNDVIIIIVGLVLAIGTYIGLQVSSGGLSTDTLRAEVYFDGELLDSIALDDYGLYPYETELGINVVEINEEGVRIIEADCPTLYCLRHVAIHKVNENIVCLPHHFHVVVVGDSEVEIDAISE